MRITREQKELLDSFHCERLSSKPENFWILDSFYNSRNMQLTENLQNSAFKEDEDNTIAYYLVKDSEGKIVLYFSLKSGMLYDEIIEMEQYEQFKSLYNLVIQGERDSNYTPEKKQQLDNLLETIRAKKGIKRELVEELFDKRMFDVDKLFKSDQHQVGKTYSGIELVHFCANDGYRDQWESLHLPQSMGRVAFWKFVVPQVLEVTKLIGCEYLFLFAADLSEDGLLIAYYNDLGFTDTAEHHVAMPLYDVSCKFMYQQINSLQVRTEAFFNDFNPDEDAI